MPIIERLSRDQIFDVSFGLLAGLSFGWYHLVEGFLENEKSPFNRTTVKSALIIAAWGSR